ILPIPAQLSSTDGVRAGRDGFVCGAGPGHCQQSQTGRFCQMSGPLQPATNREKLSEPVTVYLSPEDIAPTHGCRKSSIVCTSWNDDHGSSYGVATTRCGGR